MKLDLSKSLSFLSRLSYGKRLAPTRDWLLLVSFAILVLAALMLLTAWLYLEGAKPTGQTPVPVLAPSLSPEALKETEALFDRRMEERARYQSEYQFVDPSLPTS